MAMEGTETQTDREQLRRLLPVGSRFRIEAPQHPWYAGVILEVVAIDDCGITAHDVNEQVCNSMACKTAHCFPWEGLEYKQTLGQLLIST